MNERTTSSRKRTEDALRKSEQRLKFHLENSPLGVIEWDADFVVVQWSNEAEHIFGWSKDEIIGRTIESLNIIYPEDLPLVEGTISRLIGGNERTVVSSNRNYTKAGEVITCVWYNSVLLDENGQMSSVMSLVQDISEQQRVDVSLRESEARYRSLVESSPDGVIVHRNGFFLYANSAALAIYGAASIDHLQQYTVLDLIDEDERDAIRERMQHTAIGRHLPMRETRLVRLDGRIIPVETVGSTIAYHGTQANQIIIRDISERKKKEAELHRLNRTHRALSSSSQAMARATDEFQYMKAVCTIIEEECGYSLVWIGFTHDEDKSIRPVVFTGFEEGYLETVNITWADTERGRGPTGTAVRTGEASICADMVNDPRYLPWREQALKRGYASSIGLPLKSHGKVFGTLAIYAREPNAFSEHEAKLLIELADDLAYGITAIRLRTAHDTMVAALSQMEARYHSLFNAMTEGFALHEILVDGNGTPCDYRFIDVNESFERLTGLKREDTIGRTIREIRPTIAEKWIRIYGEVALTGVPADFESFSPLLLRHFHILAYRPAPMQCAAIYSDITDHHMIEEEIRRSRDLLEEMVVERTVELKKSEERFRNTLDNLLEGCMIIDHSWTCLYINDAMATQMGRSKNSLVGRTLADADPRFTESAAFTIYRVCMEHRIAQTSIVDVPLLDGVVRWIELHCVPVQEGIFVMSSDVTTRKQADLALHLYTEQLQSLSQRLIEAQEVERKKIAYELHDEIGQVLTAIQMNLRGIIEFEAVEDVPARLEETLGLTERLLQQVRELSVDLSPWMLDQLGLVPSVRSFLDKQARRGKFEVDFTTENITGRFHSIIEITCYRIIQESVTNIIRHARATVVKVKMTSVDGRLVTEICDNGVGFALADLQQRPADKRGLGLIGMQERIASLGGVLDFSSEPGSGTRIRITLPLD